MAIRKLTANYDIVVVGGGLAGLFAAVAAARQGARVAIVQSRSMFGGNASSEIRMHIVGADCHASKDNMRETGLIEELLLKNKSRNPYASFPVFDTMMWEMAYQQEHLTSYLNTTVQDVVMDGKNIRSVICYQYTTETEVHLSADIFVDATGHGTLGVLSGAKYRIGTESRYEFSEPSAPEVSDDHCMGDSLLFSAVDRGEPVKYVAPEWAYRFSEEDLAIRPHTSRMVFNASDGSVYSEKKAGSRQLPDYYDSTSGYWWIEVTGHGDEMTRDSEVIRDKLIRCVYGVWDHLKNVSDHGVENYDLDWVGIVPGHRESRRLDGDYVLTENDILANRVFPDAVAYGGWPMDVHCDGGIFSKQPSVAVSYEGSYTIPYRCFYSKNIGNLMMAGRDISTSKMAFSSTRVMGTCAVGGQAVGTAAALAIKHGCTVAEVGKDYITELQQLLLKNDCFIPGFRNEDPLDMARTAAVSADSETEEGKAVNVINGISRTTEEGSNCWISEPLKDRPATLTLKLPEEKTLSELRITFDSNLSRSIMPSITRKAMEHQVKTLPLELVKDYDVQFVRQGEVVLEKTIRGNGQRLNIHKLKDLCCDEVRITVRETYGHESARVYEVRLY